MKDWVSGEWLAQNLNNKGIVVVDCRFQLTNPGWGYEQYSLSHIPGAYYLDLNQDLSTPVQVHGGRHPLPDLNNFAEKLANIGIVKDETLVVAYDDSRFAFAARLWWLLRYLGHTQVALLNGGWQGWRKNNYPVTNIISQPSSGSFVAQPQTDWIVDRQTVQSRKDLASVILVDSRDSDRYAGIKEPIDPIAGHIPGAINSSWKLVTDEQGYLRPLSEQKKLGNNYSSAQEIIVYCGSGVTACVNLFSCKLAEIDKVKLYPGGWSDWCSYLELD
jgi:thiosulfate/3-mercaptopyruvate sulfurtransferase